METPDSTPRAQEASAPPVPAGGVWRRLAIWLGAGVALLGVGMGVLIGSVVLFSLEQHPVVGAYVRDKLVNELQGRLGEGARLSIRSVDLLRDERGTRVRVENMVVRDRAGLMLLSAPAGTVTLETLPLAGLRLVPRAIELDSLRMTAAIERDGALRFGVFEAVEPSDAGGAAASNGPPSALSIEDAIGGLFVGLARLRDAVGGKLPELGVRNAALSVADHRTGRRIEVTGVNGHLRVGSNAGTQARAEVMIENTPVAVDIDLSPPQATQQTMTAVSRNVAIGPLAHALGISDSVIDPRARLDVSLTVEADGSMQARSAVADFIVNGLRITVNPTEAPLPVDAGRLTLRWQAGEPSLSVTSVDLRSGDSQVVVGGHLSPPDRDDAPWRLALNGQSATLDALTPTDRPVQLASIDVAATLDPKARVITLEQLAIAGPATSARLRGVATQAGDGRPELALDLVVEDTDARQALRIWPRFFAPHTRDWLVKHMPAGHLETLTLAMRMDADAVELAIADRPLPEKALALAWTLRRSVLAPLAQAPVLRDLSITGRASGKDVRIDVLAGHLDAGDGRRLQLGRGSFIVPNTQMRDPAARVVLPMTGPAEALLAAARSPGLAPFMGRPSEATKLRGQASVDLTLAMQLKHVMDASDVRASLVGTLSKLTIEGINGLDRIENADLAMTVDRNGLMLKGEGQVFGTPAAIEVRGQGKSVPVATLTLTLDETARARKGIRLAPMLTGPVTAKLTAPLAADAGKQETVAEIDFTRAVIADLLPGWNKRAGQTARARGALSELPGGGWRVDRFEIDAGPVAARGSLDLGKDGGLVKASLSSFRLSPGDAVQVDAERTGATTRISVKGNAFDARPFLKSLQTGGIDKTNASNTEITLRSTVLSGFGGELVTNADLKLEKRGNTLTRFDLNGRFDGGPIVARLTSQAGSAPVLTVESYDAGAFLRFFDLYSRMQGGEMQLSVTMGTGSQQGSVVVRDFALRNEPAMKRLVTDMASQNAIDGSRLAPEVARRLAQARDVPFDRMTLGFRRTPGRLDIRESLLVGPEIGGSMTGSMDYQRDRVALTGTFVPAYSLNNLFAKVPLFGPLLGGGRNEGLFAVRYSISGPMSAPVLSIDPLTAIAPGFLRKLIDVRGLAPPPAQPAD